MNQRQKVLNVRRRLLALSIAVLALQLAGCADTSVQVGLHTRSTVYCESLLGKATDAGNILTATPTKVGTLQGVSPSAPLRGLGTFASDAVRVGIHKACPQATVLTGPATLAVAHSAGVSMQLGKLLSDAQDTGILQPEQLTAIGKATGLEYFILATVAHIDMRSDGRFGFLGTTIVRSNWTTMNLVMQLWHAPSGRIVWQSVGDCTGYSESPAASPVSIHQVTSDLATVMVRDLMTGHSRSKLFHRERAAQSTIKEGSGTGSGGSSETRAEDADEWVRWDEPDIEPEPK